MGQNLVPNFSFEQYSSCPTQSSEIIFATGWSDANTGTADYYNACFTTGGVSVDVPNNWMGFQNANFGDAYGGIMLFENSSTITDYREYLQAQLASTLINGVKYYVSFRVSHSDSSCYVTDDIGVYFSNTQISQGDFLFINQTPQLENTDNNFLNSNSTWIKIEGSFIASGGENYITIGNFKDDINTDTIPVCTTSNLDYKSAYYYIDDICVSTDSLTCVNPVGIQTINLNNNNYNIIIKNGNLTVNSYINSSFNVSLFDISGKLIHQSFNHRNLFQFNISQLNPSIYFVNIYNNLENHTQKIFINH